MERLSDHAAEITRQEWRDFGLYYISDDASKEWHLHGSKAGLLGFAEILDSYAAKPANAGQSEHEHLGPHMYLTLTSWPVARLDGRGIWGLPQDLRRLANYLRSALPSVVPDQVLRVKEQYAPAAEYAFFCT